MAPASAVRSITSCHSENPGPVGGWAGVQRARPGGQARPKGEAEFSERTSRADVVDDAALA
jgi:hypothetical protein